MTEDYLKVIWKAQEWPAEAGSEPSTSITTSEIAATLGVGAPTVSGNLKKLAREGFINYEPYGPITLTEVGSALAVQMVRRHRIIETYLVERLGFSWDEVHDEAEVLEHAISDVLLARFDEVLGFPIRDPHGDPIPRANGEVIRPVAARLSEFADGQCGIIVRVADDDPELLRYLRSLDLVVGSHVRVHTRRSYAGSVSVGRTFGAPAAEFVADAAGTHTTEETVELADVVAAAIWATTEEHEHVVITR